MNSRLLPAFALCLLTLSGSAILRADFRASITIGPPPIPYYDQPPMPEDGYVWTPGYWAYGDSGYFWVPGTWVANPGEGLLWTPGYWSWNDRFAVFHGGYWGRTVGFYGGINYGYGYGGDGFQGGHWQGRNYYYNQSVTNMGDTRVTHVYNQTYIQNNNSRVGFNGGTGGIHASPSGAQRAAARERHVPATAQQEQHHRQAGQDQQLLATVNHGNPAVAATRKPSDFSGQHAMPGKGPGGRFNEAPAGNPRPAAPARPGNGRERGAQEPAQTRPQPAPNQGRQDHGRPQPIQPQQPPNRIPGLERRPQPAPSPTQEPRRDPLPRPSPTPRVPQEPRQQAPRAPEQRPQAPRPQEQRPQAPSAPEQRPQAPRPQEQRPQAPRPQEQRPQAPRPQEQHPQAPHPNPGREREEHPKG
jgi:hypothetical protein